MAFARTTSGLTGEEKAAVLFVALGQTAWSGITSRLTRKELKKLRLAVKRTRYGFAQEYTVLQEVEQYGLRKGIWPNIRHVAHKIDIKVDDNNKTDSIKQTASERPDEVAKLIGKWLGGAE